MSFLDPSQGVYNAFSVLFTLYPIWLPIILLAIFWQTWMDYVRYKFIKEQGSMLLEIRIPTEMLKSPAAMELVFTSLYQTGSATWIETYIKGKVRPWWSLELVSLGGQVKFYIWTWPKFRHLLETHLYAQFPTIEIIEAEDYAANLVHDPENQPMWSMYYKMGKQDAYPLKTYVDYGLDRDPKEEFKIDPMTNVLEYLGSVQRGEQVWIQIMMRAHKKEGLKEGRFLPKPDWKKEAKGAIAKIRDVAKDDKSGFSRFLTKGETDLIAAIERSLTKYPFEVVIRSLYTATKEANRIGTMISGLIGSFRQYSGPEGFNEFKTGWFTDFDYPWQDFHRSRRNKVERRMLDAYKKRSIFHFPHENWHQRPFILTTEELATIYHFPGQVATTPTFQRIVSRKGEPPANLPM